MECGERYSPSECIVRLGGTGVVSIGVKRMFALPLATGDVLNIARNTSSGRIIITKTSALFQARIYVPGRSSEVMDGAHT
jgi:hypothetical protein